MSSSIWMRCGGKSNLRALALTAWRVVEAQHITSTRKLVDSDAEHEALEQLIDAHKPLSPREPEFRGLHYLLSTPFRYPPLRHGSRFGTRQERGLWYGSESITTAFSEVAYYRMLFLEGTLATLPARAIDVSAFHVPVRSERAADLVVSPFDRYRSRISSRTRYDDAQRIGRDLRECGAELARYVSARDPGFGTNVVAFSPKAFARKRPSEPQTWSCITTRAFVELSRKSFFERASFRFVRRDFEVRGVLPSPAV